MVLVLFRITYRSIPLGSNSAKPPTIPRNPSPFNIQSGRIIWYLRFSKSNLSLFAPSRCSRTAQTRRLSCNKIYRLEKKVCFSQNIDAQKMKTKNTLTHTEYMIFCVLSNNHRLSVSILSLSLRISSHHLAHICHSMYESVWAAARD